MDEHNHPDQNDNHDHDASHSHSPLSDRSAKRKPLAIALAITTIFLVVEVIGGIAANSLALLADAGHMATDAGALLLALFAAWLAGRPATPRRSFGFMRAEILAAAVNAAILLLLSLYIFYEAWQRFSDPPEIRSGLMLGVAVAGLGANIVSAWVLSRGGGHQHDLNTRGAFLHVIGDLLGSVATIVAALIIMATGWTKADPILSVVIGGLIVFSAWKLLKEAVDILLEATPSDIDPASGALSAQAPAGHRRRARSARLDRHLRHRRGQRASGSHQRSQWPEILEEASHVLADEFSIAHSTLQPEEYHPDRTGPRACSLDSDEGLAICQTVGTRSQVAASVK